MEQNSSNKPDMKAVNSQFNEVLNGIESIIVCVDSSTERLDFTPEGLRTSMLLFNRAMQTAMWQLQEKENINMPDRLLMSERLGSDIRKLVKTYCDIDTHELYK